MDAVPHSGAAHVGAASKQSKRRGPRPKHVPQRMCVACRDHAAKRTLVRLVRTTEGAVEVDPTGKKNGRGAYLCETPACWEKALKTGLLSRALNITLSQETIASPRQHAASLPPPKVVAVGSVEEGS